MFTASLNLEALQQATQGTPRICATDGCEQPVPQTPKTDAQYCSDHSKQRARQPRRAKKARR